MNPEIPAAFRGVRPELLILDVDGVLTTNTIHLNGRGEETKPFFVPDGVGIKLLQSIGVEVCLLSGRRSPVVEARAKELGIARYQSGITSKGPAVEQLLAETGVAKEHAVYMGDDLVDLSAMSRVALPVAVANAHPVVLERAVAVTVQQGGAGAVREVCEWILIACGEWDGVVERFSQ